MKQMQELETMLMQNYQNQWEYSYCGSYHKYNKKNLSLYRDDALMLIRSNNSRVMDKYNKNLERFFKSYKLSVEIKTNLNELQSMNV